MKRADIKVGQTYGVRLSASERSTVVPATVVSIDEPVSWMEHKRWSGGMERVTKPKGGILVKFEQPTRVGWREFALASETNDHAGKVEKTYAFHDDRHGRGQTGRLFVGSWARIEADRKAADEAQQAQYNDAQERADAFAPVLEAHMGRLKSLGLDVSLHADSSGIYGDIDQSISTRDTSDSYRGRRPTGFAYDDVRVEPKVFEWLLDCAEASGQKFEKAQS